MPSFAFVVSVAVTALAVWLAVGAAALAAVGVYRLVWHPYAKYPGPLLAKVTNLYAVYHSWKGDLHIDMWRCHEKYGGFVRYGPNEIIVNSAAGLKDIYSHGKNFKKSRKYNAMVHRATNTLTTVDKKAHGKKRRLISQAFSDNALRSYEEVILKHVDQLCTQLRRKEEGKEGNIAEGTWGTAKNMARWCDYFTFDIMCNVIFGVPWSSLTDEKYRYVPHVIEQSNVRVAMLIEAGGLKNVKIDKYLFRPAIAARNRFVKFVNEIIREGMQLAGKSSKGAFALLRNATDPETKEPLSLKELGGESATLIVAGTDTTSTALAATMFYLNHHPTAYATVANEVRNAFQSRDEIRLGPKLNQCTYLRACVEESMRLSPSAPGPLWRQVDAGGAVVDGEYIAEGLDVATCVYAVHHNPEIYPQPSQFIPERWLNDTPSVQGAIRPQTGFTPFSIGPRSCIGKSLAYMELTLTVSHLLWDFDMRLAGGELGHVGEGHPDAEKGRQQILEFQLENHITASKDGPWIEFRPRTAV